MEKEKVTRTLSAVVGLPILAVVLIFANTIIMDVFTAIIACISMYEYFNCFKASKKANPTKALGYFYCILIAFTHFVDSHLLYRIMVAIIPVSILILFTELIFSNGKKTVKDIAVTILGICYIPLMLINLSFIRNMRMPMSSHGLLLDTINAQALNGKMLIWFVLIASWGSDVFAYSIGKKFGKHKLTPISPNKTIEGSVAGIIGSVVLGIIYSVLCNTLWGTGINYVLVGIIVAMLSVVGQIGDLAASSIKRYCEIKDFSDLIPGHGGMLDRIDSIIFVLPFAFLLLNLL